MRSRQSTYPGVCLLCNTQLISTEPTSSQQSIVQCPSCGYSGPHVRRQRYLAPNADQQLPASQGGPAVWIDPAVSAFFVDGQPGKVEYTQNNLQPRSQHQSKKPQSMSSSLNKGPVTPIPPRASAQRPNNVKVRPKYLGTQAHHHQQQDNDITRMPTFPPPTMWQYESPEFEVESSLSALSLIVDAPTHPGPSFSPRQTDRLSNHGEIDTLPAPQLSRTDIDKLANPPRRKSNQVDIDEIDTLTPTPGGGQSSRSLASVNSAPQPVLAPASPAIPSINSGVDYRDQGKLALTNEITDPLSWTAGSASGSSYARRITERPKGARRKQSLYPVDRIRWWLLHPGRIEFILWLGGTILLLSVTVLLLFVMAVSLSRIDPGTPRGSIPPLPSAGKSSPGASTTVTNGNLILTLFDTMPLIPGQALHLHGQGFSRRGSVFFTDENNHPLLKQDSQINSIQADENGSFFVTLNDSAWAAGSHQVVARDAATGKPVDLNVTLAPGPFGKNATPTPAVPPPGLTATATSTNGPGTFPTVVGPTPVPPIPTAVTTPPVPTPTQQPVPTPTATPIVTPIGTPGATPTVETTPTPGADSSLFYEGSNAVLTSAANSIAKSDHLARAGSNLLDSWSWLLMLGYIFAMFMLGIAGILYKRRNNT